jgi:hypothetical protein
MTTASAILTSDQGMAVVAAWKAFGGHAQGCSAGCRAALRLVRAGEKVAFGELHRLACADGLPLLKEWHSEMGVYMESARDRARGRLRRIV